MDWKNVVMHVPGADTMDTMGTALRVWLWIVRKSAYGECVSRLIGSDLDSMKYWALP